MESFVAIMLSLALVVMGGFIGNLNGTNDISNKEITEAGKVCEPFEGVYKINKGFKKAIAFCKDGSQVELKGEK